MKKPKTMKEWAARSTGRSGNTRRGAEFEQRVSSELGGAGWACDVVEISRQMIVRNGRSAWMTKKADFFGCIDIIAVKPGFPALFIQTTLDDSESMFRRKAAEIENVFVAESAGRRILIVQKCEDADNMTRYKIRELRGPGSWESFETFDIAASVELSGS